MDIEEELQKIDAKLSYLRALRTPDIWNKLEEYHRRCILKADKDPETFISCISGIDENVAYQEDIITIKTDFLLKKARECIQKKGLDSKNIKICQEEAEKNLGNYFTHYYKSI